MFEYALTAWGLINWHFAAAKEQILINLPLQDATRRVRPTMTSAPDDVLELLRQRGRHLDPSALDALMRGVAAAPEGLAGPEWVELIDPQADPELTKALTAWIAENLTKGGKLGFDPWLQTVDGHERFARACQRAGGEFVPVDSNPVDAVWPDRPPAPLAPVLPHPDEFAGESSEAKRLRIAGTIMAKGADVALITAPDSIAWLLNVPAAPVPPPPFPLAFPLPPPA